jgi:hypothetical protein
MSRLPSRIVLACVCGVVLACRHAPPSIPDQARLYAGVGNAAPDSCVHDDVPLADRATPTASTDSCATGA